MERPTDQLTAIENAVCYTHFLRGDMLCHAGPQGSTGVGQEAEEMGLKHRQ